MGVFFAICTSLSWAVIPIFIKPASAELSSANISFFRLVAGFAGLLLISGLSPGWKERCKQTFKPAAFAGLLFAYHYWSYIEGVAWSGPALGRVLIGLGSVFLALMGILLFGEQLGRIQKLGIALAFVGVGSFTFSLYGSKIGDINFPAALLLTSSAAVWACYAGIQRTASRTGLGSEFLVIMFAFASACTALLTQPSQFLETTPIGLCSTALLGLLTVSGYFCFSNAIGKIPASHVSVITCASPIVTLVLLLGIYYMFPNFLPPEDLTISSLAFAGLNICGVILVVTQRK